MLTRLEEEFPHDVASRSGFTTEIAMITDPEGRTALYEYVSVQATSQQCSLCGLSIESTEHS
jgi:hypothetical protein